MESLKISSLEKNQPSPLQLHHGFLTYRDNRQLAVVSSNQDTYNIDLVADTVKTFNVGDQVLYSWLDNGQLVLMSTLKPQNLEGLREPKDKFSFSHAGHTLSIDETGIHLQAGKSTLSLSKDGTIEIKGSKINQKADHLLDLKSSTIKIN